MRPKRILPMNRTWTLQLQEEGKRNEYWNAIEIPLSKEQRRDIDVRVLSIIKHNNEPTQKCDI